MAKRIAHKPKEAEELTTQERLIIEAIPDKRDIEQAPPIEADEISEAPKQFFSLPTSPAYDLLYRVMAGGRDNLPDIGKRQRQVSHSSTITVMEKKDARLITSTTGKDTVSIEIGDINLLSGSKKPKPAKKMLVFFLVKIAEQAYHNGELSQAHIGFTLKELVEIGMYGSTDTARRGFKAGVDILTSTKIKGKLHKGKSNHTIEELQVLFTGARIEDGYCTVYLNHNIDWSFIASFFTILPRYAFKLSSRSFDLICYIFFLARQNMDSIKEKGHFNIRMRAIHARLNLPNEDKSLNPQRDIKDAIDDAITEIEEAGDTSDFTITPHYDMNAPISDFLENGYIQIGLSGQYSQGFIDLEKRFEADRKKALARTEKIIDAARTKAMVAQLKQEETPVNGES